MSLELPLVPGPSQAVSVNPGGSKARIHSLRLPTWFAWDMVVEMVMGGLPSSTVYAWFRIADTTIGGDLYFMFFKNNDVAFKPSNSCLLNIQGL